MTKYHSLDGLTNLYSHNSGGWKSKFKVSVDFVSPGASLLGLHMAAFPLYPYMTFSLCVHTSLESFFYKDTDPLGSFL